MTRCDVRVQILVVDVLKLVIEAMRENFNKITQGKQHSVRNHGNECFTD